MERQPSVDVRGSAGGHSKQPLGVDGGVRARERRWDAWTSWRLWLAYALGALAIGAGCLSYYESYWGTYENFNRSIEFCELPYCDFVLFYYQQAKVILVSHEPIHKYFYSPTFALFLVPLAGLPLEQAVAVWTGVQVASLVLFVGAGLWLLRGQPRWTHAVFFLLTLTSYPILHNWKWGQANTAFIALSMSSLALAERGPAWLRGLPLALATSARYYPAMYALGFVERRQWRALVWFGVLAALLLFALPALTMGPAAALDFYAASAKASSEATKTWVLGYGGSQYISSVLGRHGAALHLDAPAALPFLIGVGYALATLNFWVAARGTGDTPRLRTLWLFTFVGCNTPLLLPTSWVHYFVYLPLVHSFLLVRTLGAALPWAVRAALLLALWSPSVVLTSIFFFNEQGPHVDYTSGGYPFYASMLALLLAHLLAARERHAASLARRAQSNASP